MRIKRLQLTPNSSLQSIRVTVLAAGTAPQRWRSALLGAAEPHIRYTAEANPPLSPARRRAQLCSVRVVCRPLLGHLCFAPLAAQR